ncbi:MAG: hypothetical protein R3275_05305 [Saprospiraceae bacterium]|nr:hypothetical protein [Saprospiraceae bacterium]
MRAGHSDGVEKGDTFFLKVDDIFVPALEVTQVSSISSVCQKLGDFSFETGDPVFHFKIERKKQVKQPDQDTLEDISSEEVVPDTLIDKDGYEENLKYKQKIRGRISASAHSNFGGDAEDLNYRLRYTASFDGLHLKNSPLSTDIYVAYRHNMGPNTENNRSRAEALRIYSLAFSYDFGENIRTTLGRRINRNLSNVGAIDGVQFEQDFGKLKYGLVAGSRPDIGDYGFNFDLKEYGAFIAFEDQEDRSYHATSLAFFEQRNSGNIDRRFTYFQHNSMPIENLNVFASFEVDWYKLQDEEVSVDPRLSSLYLSMRYRFNRKISLFASYDNRNNIIYYETYKSLVDRLLDEATRQGMRLRLNIRPFKYFSVGVTGGYRFQKDNPNESKNVYTYLTYSRVPWINASVTLSTNWLETAYLTGNIYRIRLNKDIIRGKLFMSLHFRLVDYQFPTYGLKQRMGGINLSWRVFKKLSFSTNYEGTFDDRNQYHRFHVNLVQRF